MMSPRLKPFSIDIEPVDVAHTYGSRHTWRNVSMHCGGHDADERICFKYGFIRIHISDDHNNSDRCNVQNQQTRLVTPETDSDSGKKTCTYDPHLDPALVWAGKTEHTSFEIPTVSLHVHERIDPCTIIESVRKRGTGVERQKSLFEFTKVQGFDYYNTRTGDIDSGGTVSLPFEAGKNRRIAVKSTTEAEILEKASEVW